MAAVTTQTVEFDLLFQDDTTKTLSFGPFASDADFSNLKNNVMNFEHSFNSDTAKLMASKYGNDWAGFQSVKIISVRKNVLF